MAELYLARTRDPEQLVVLKRLRSQLALDPEFIRMFLDEGRLAMTLRHPNIVEVYEVGEDAGQYHIAMEYLHGHDLRETMARLTERHIKVPLAQALSVARAVAAALHYTHEQTSSEGESLGIVHRDVSPHNVLLTYDGRVKLVDFGIAKTSTQRSRTRTGVLKGKVAYMAPEQAMGMAIDRRSDLFCLGILLWEMTTGRWLFRLRTELDTLNAVAHSRPPRPSRITPDYPRDLEKLIMKALARSPADRWATAADLISAIDDVARRRKVTVGPEQISALTALAFTDELAAWRAVQSFGISLADHLVAQHDREATFPADSDLDTENDGELPPLPSLQMTRLERFTRSRARWPVFVGAAIAGVAAAWFTTRDVSAPAHPAPSNPGAVPAAVAPARPGAAGGAPGTAGAPAPAAVPGTTTPAGTTAAGITPTASVPSVGATGTGADSPAPAGPTGGTAAVRPGTGSAEMPIPRSPRITAPASSGRPEAGGRDPLRRTPSAKPAVKPRITGSPAVEHIAPALPRVRVAPAAPVAPPPAPRPPVDRPASKPTNADLDKLP